MSDDTVGRIVKLDGKGRDPRSYPIDPGAFKRAAPPCPHESKPVRAWECERATLCKVTFPEMGLFHSGWFDERKQEDHARDCGGTLIPLVER